MNESNPLNGLENEEIAHLIKLMDEPMRSVDRCVSKGQLRTLCLQLLTENLALKTKLKKASIALEALGNAN